MKFFSTTAYIFRFRPSSGGNFWSKLDQNCKLWVRLFFINPSISFQTMFLFARVLPMARISAILDHIWQSKGPKTSQKGHLMDAESVRKTLKTFNLTISNTILTKLTMIMYLHKRLNRKSLRNKNSILGVMSTNFWYKLKIAAYVCITLRCITGKVFVQIPWKATQNRSKMIATQTFEGL